MPTDYRVSQQQQAANNWNATHTHTHSVSLLLTWKVGILVLNGILRVNRLGGHSRTGWRSGSRSRWRCRSGRLYVHRRYGTRTVGCQALNQSRRRDIDPEIGRHLCEKWRMPCKENGKTMVISRNSRRRTAASPLLPQRRKTTHNNKKFLPPHFNGKPTQTM